MYYTDGKHKVVLTSGTYQKALNQFATLYATKQQLDYQTSNLAPPKREQLMQNAFFSFMEDYQKFVGVTRDMHDIRDFLGDMRLCFVVLTISSFVIAFIYLFWLGFSALCKPASRKQSKLVPRPSIIEPGIRHIPSEVNMHGESFKTFHPLGSVPSDRRDSVVFDRQDLRWHRKTSAMVPQAVVPQSPNLYGPRRPAYDESDVNS